MDAAQAGVPGWRIVVLCPEGMLAQRLRDMDIAIITGEFGPSAGFRKSYMTLRRHLRHLQPEVVHSHLAYADVVAAAAALGTKVRLVTTEHGIAGDDSVYHGAAWKSRAKATMHRVRLLRADAVIAVSGATKNAMLAKWKPRQSIAVIPNCVNRQEIRRRVEAFKGDTERTSNLHVLSLSRLAPEKGLDTLLNAFALVLNENPEARLTVAGEGPERATLECLADSLGIGGAVDFPGFVDPLAAMAKADVLVQLSVWENCSYTLLDAVGAGIGIVATAVGGNPEIVGPQSLVAGTDPGEVASHIFAQLVRSTTEPKDLPLGNSVRTMTDQIALIYAGLQL